MIITAELKRRCAERELAKRKHVYPRLVTARKMTRRNADTEIAIMQAIADDYREAEKADRLL